MFPKRLKVAHIIGHLHYGGAENQVIQLLNGLNTNLMQKYLIIYEDAEPENLRLLDRDISIINLKLRRWGQLFFLYRLVRLIRKEEFDVIQAHMFHSNLYVAIAGILARIPVIITTDHGMNLWKNKIHHFLEKNVISPIVDKRVVVSKNIFSLRLVSKDFPLNKMLMIPNCVKIPIKYKKTYSTSVFKIGTVGRFVPAKDYNTLILAFKKVIEAGIKAELVFVGDGVERDKLQSIVNEIGINNLVKFEGFQKDVLNYLRKFDIFAMSSIREGIPVAMLEAMAMGVPVVATKVGGIPEVIKNRITGILVEKRNTVTFAEALLELIEDRTLRTKIGEAGKEMIKKNYSVEKICKQYDMLYLQMFKHRSK